MKVSEIQQKSTTVQTGTKCDCCGIIINEILPKTWHHFDSHHGDWGNDSHESYEYFDACSAKCFIEIAKKNMNDGTGITRPPIQSTVQVSGFNEQFLFELLKLINP